MPSECSSPLFLLLSQRERQLIVRVVSSKSEGAFKSGRVVPQNRLLFLIEEAKDLDRADLIVGIENIEAGDIGGPIKGLLCRGNEQLEPGLASRSFLPSAAMLRPASPGLASGDHPVLDLGRVRIVILE
jgi:hypothetical protein